MGCGRPNAPLVRAPIQYIGVHNIQFYPAATETCLYYGGHVFGGEVDGKVLAVVIECIATFINVRRGAIAPSRSCATGLRARPRAVHAAGSARSAGVGAPVGGRACAPPAQIVIPRSDGKFLIGLCMEIL
jgi:hypothetical protein